MKHSDNCIKLVKKWEGLYLTSYKCPAGVWTVGWGSITYEDGTPVKQGQTITKARALELLNWELEKKGEQINKLNITVNQNQYDSLLSFTYNVGIGALRRSTLLKLIRVNPDDPEIRKQFMRWVNKGSAFEKGLTNRRKQEADLYFAK